MPAVYKSSPGKLLTPFLNREFPGNSLLEGCKELAGEVAAIDRLHKPSSTFHAPECFCIQLLNHHLLGICSGPDLVCNFFQFLKQPYKTAVIPTICS